MEEEMKTYKKVVKDPAGIKRTIGLDTGTTWTDEDERKLMRLSKKTDIQALAQIFRRTPTAIRYRLKLLKDQGHDVRISEYKGKGHDDKDKDDNNKGHDP